jgi:large subunit ribosomal protein L28
MAFACEICNKKPQYGNTISHAHNVTRRRWNPNLRRVRAVVKGANVHIRVSFWLGAKKKLPLLLASGRR